MLYTLRAGKREFLIGKGSILQIWIQYQGTGLLSVLPQTGSDCRPQLFSSISGTITQPGSRCRGKRKAVFDSFFICLFTHKNMIKAIK